MPDVDIDPDDDATILYTSGTTGHPKGAVSTHRAVVQALMGFGCRSAADRLRNPDATPSTDPLAFILVVPLFHVTGCVPVMLSCLSSGLKLVIMYKWDPDRALELIERERVTNFVGVPTQSWDLLASPQFAAARHVEPAQRRRRRRTGAARTRAAGGVELREGEPRHRLRHDRDQRVRAAERRRGLPHPSDEHRPCHAHPRGRSARRARATRSPAGEAGEIWFKGPNLIRGLLEQA